MVAFSPKSQTYLKTLHFIGATKIPLKAFIGEHKHKQFCIFIFAMEMVCYSYHFLIAAKLYM